MLSSRIHHIFVRVVDVHTSQAVVNKRQAAIICLFFVILKQKKSEINVRKIKRVNVFVLLLMFSAVSPIGCVWYVGVFQ